MPPSTVGAAISRPQRNARKNAEKAVPINDLQRAADSRPYGGPEALQKKMQVLIGETIAKKHTIIFKIMLDK